MELLRLLRGDARIKLVTMSSMMGMPVSTLQGRYIKLRSGIIGKFCANIDYPGMGFSVRFFCVVGAKKDFRNFIVNHHNINSAFRHSKGYFIDCIFRNLGEADAFLKHLEKLEAKVSGCYFVIDEIKMEGMLCRKIS